MDFEDIVKIFTFLLGTALQIALLALMVKRKRSKRRELAFAFFTFSVLSWSFGIFISMFCGYIYRGDNIIEKSFGAFAILSFTAIFPLLTHSLLTFMEQKNFISPFFKYILLPAFYLPTFVFVSELWRSFHTLTPVLTTMENFIGDFLPWAFVPLIASWYFIVRLCRKIEDQEERRFLSMVGWGITLTLCSYFFTFVLDGRTLYIIGPYLVLLTEAFTFLLPPMLAYYLYFYNYMEYVLKRGIIYCVLGIFIIAFYLSAIRPLGAGMEKKLQINFRMVEGILVMAMVFFFDPLKRVLQELSNRIFFSEQKYYRKVFSDLSLMVNQDTHSDPETLLEYVAWTINRAMKIREVSFILFEEEKGQLKIKESTIFVPPEDIQHIIAYIKKHRVQVLTIYSLEENQTEVLRAMRRIKAFTVIAIYDKGELIGIFNVGKRRVRHQLLAEEEEMLIMLVNQIVTAIKNSRLTREKFAMERKMYENEKMSSLGRLSASIAHEVKNPLSSIKTIAQVMNEELPKDDPNQEGLTLVIEEVDRLSRVVQQLLRFARPHSGTLKKVAVNEVLQNVLLLLHHEADRNHVTIKNYLEERDLEITSDQDALIEIFFNLIHNGIQALPQGGMVSITYKIEAPENQGEPPWLKIYVRDNGPGIPVEERDKLFEPFYTTKQTGTGLGLAIVKSRVQKLKGDVKVCYDQPGTVFEVSLPLTYKEETSDIPVASYQNLPAGD